MEESRLARRRILVTALISAAASVWALWVAYAAVALRVQSVPATWPVFALFLAGILVFLLPAFAFMLYRTRPDSPLRFHAGIWLIITGYYWIVAPLYQYLAINTNRELVLWYMIPYAWEVPALGLLYYLPLAFWYRRGRDLSRLPLFAALYFALIALIGYGPVGSYQFRVFGEAPLAEVAKNMLTGTIMGFISGFIVYFYLNLVVRHKKFTIRRELTAVAAALVVLSYVIYVPVSYRSAQELAAAAAGENLLIKLALGEGQLYRRVDAELLMFEPEITATLRTLDRPQKFFSHRRDNAVVAAAPAGEFVRVAIKSEAEYRSLLAPFVYRGVSVGAVFGGIFALLMTLLIRLAEAYERRRNAELSFINSELHEKTEVVERVLADVKAVDEKLAHLNRAKSEFISMASHQLRTPLTAVKWYAKLFEKEGTAALSAHQRRALHHMAASNQKMIELVNDLLNVSRIEMSTIAVIPEKLNAREYLRGVVREHSPIAEAARVSLRLAVAPDETFSADPRLLDAALSNLITNAIRYSQSRRGKVVVSAARRGGRLEFTVSDNGYGIPPDEQAKVFSKFFRASNIVSKVPEGTGLGLYITRSVINELGGAVSFVSTPGKGTTFTVRIPRRGVHPKEGKPIAYNLKT